MIQRIQTLFIMVVVVLQSILPFLPIVKSLGADGTQIICKPINVVPLAILCVITSLIAAISVFLYRKRIIQMRISIFNSIVLVALQAYIVYYLVSFNKEYTTVQYCIPAIFPLLSTILSLLAARSILKDELLIKTLDRIR